MAPTAWGDYRVLGATRDVAADSRGIRQGGQAPRTSRIPAAGHIERIAKDGDPSRFPRFAPRCLRSQPSSRVTTIITGRGSFSGHQGPRCCNAVRAVAGTSRRIAPPHRARFPGRALIENPGGKRCYRAREQHESSFAWSLGGGRSACNQALVGAIKSPRLADSACRGVRSICAPGRTDNAAMICTRRVCFTAVARGA
jgi:hypothetical protein